ncbi:PfkB family carbohydrate kinase [Reichenbachiella sp. MALMAid0571]
MNFAAHCAQCGQYAGMISSLGQDELGDQALEMIKKLKVDTALIQRSVSRDTGTVLVTLENGQPDYEVLAGVAYDYVYKEELDESEIGEYDAFYFGSIIQRNKVSRETLYYVLDNYEFDKIFYDVNLRKDCYSKPIIEKSLGYCNILKVNDDEVSILSDILFGNHLGFEAFSKEVIKQFSQIKIIIITTGKKGCVLYYDGQLVTVPGVAVNVKDTVGAGDSFSAAFLSTYYKTGDPIKSASIANHVGGFVASMSGAIPRYSDGILALLS